MRVKELVWGVAAWPLLAVMGLLAAPGDGDLPMGTLLTLLLGTALVFAALGAAIWLPLALLVERRLARLSDLARTAIITTVGFGIGALFVTVLTVHSRNASWPESLGLILTAGTAAALASLAGCLLAYTLRRAQVNHASGQPLPPAPREL
ncbi:Kef-type K+ transport system membrane component KefB [Arthrobacter woluwensis]|uniref:hypothetical protein n=1 Tax=Arthrobacter woluwensis TaxID=156980 RepID=UPI002786A2A1|nr:hypothetical protein [Arthrobacter woluwensis]MDQ0708612.1 Kef-type K+ transport system membrane component KefB [Arthrobacter woluwensis]